MPISVIFKGKKIEGQRKDSANLRKEECHASATKLQHIVTHTQDIITLVYIMSQSSLYTSLEERKAKPEVLPPLANLSGSSLGIYQV